MMIKTWNIILRDVTVTLVDIWRFQMTAILSKNYSFFSCKVMRNRTKRELHFPEALACHHPQCSSPLWVSSTVKVVDTRRKKGVTKLVKVQMLQLVLNLACGSRLIPLCQEMRKGDRETKNCMQTLPVLCWMKHPAVKRTPWLNWLKWRLNWRLKQRQQPRMQDLFNHW